MSNQPSPTPVESAFGVLLQACTAVPCQRWEDREAITTAVQIVRSALVERQQLLDGKNAAKSTAEPVVSPTAEKK